MVQCTKCKTPGFRPRDVRLVIINGKSELICQECTREILGMQKPDVFIKKV